MSGTPTGAWRPAPRLVEPTEEVLRSITKLPKRLQHLCICSSPEFLKKKKLDNYYLTEQSTK